MGHSNGFTVAHLVRPVGPSARTCGLRKRNRADVVLSLIAGRDSNLRLRVMSGPSCVLHDTSIAVA